MRKGFTITAASAIVAAGSLVGGAQAGGSATSAPSKYSHHSTHYNQYAGGSLVRTGANGFGITEFSSSSAPTGAPGPRR